MGNACAGWGRGSKSTAEADVVKRGEGSKGWGQWAKAGGIGRELLEEKTSKFLVVEEKRKYKTALEPRVDGNWRGKWEWKLFTGGIH